MADAPVVPLIDLEGRKAALRAWIESDPEVREGLIELDPGLKALAADVAKLERLAVGFRAFIDR